MHLPGLVGGRGAAGLEEGLVRQEELELLAEKRLEKEKQKREAAFQIPDRLTVALPLSASFSAW